MIIINQDKDMIVNLNNISSIRNNDVWDDKPGQMLTAVDITGHTYSLGYYKNEKRAEEVLLTLATVIASTGDLEKEYFLMPKE